MDTTRTGDGSHTRTVVVRCPMCATLNRVDLSRIEDRPKCAHCSRPILLDRPLAVTDDDFDRVVEGSEVPVLVDFYADWCGPCKTMAPALDAIAHAHAGRALVLKLDTDRNPRVSHRFDVRSIPTLIVFRGGKEAARQVGAAPRQRLEQMLGVVG
jgi:thioredoxin 2